MRNLTFVKVKSAGIFSQIGKLSFFSTIRLVIKSIISTTNGIIIPIEENNNIISSILFTGFSQAAAKQTALRSSLLNKINLLTINNLFCNKLQNVMLNIQ